MPNPTLVAGSKNSAAIAATNTAATVTSTGSVTSGHLQIVMIEIAGASAPTGITPPGGWSTLLTTTTTQTAGVVSAAIFYKLATVTGAFSGSFSWTTSSTGGEWLFMEWAGVGPANVDGTLQNSLNATSTTPTSPTITPTAGNPLDTLVVALFGGTVASSTVAIPSGTSSILAVNGTGSSPLLGAASLALTGTAATGTKSWTLGTTETTLGVSFLLPASQVWTPGDRWSDSAPRKPGETTKAQRGKLFVPFFQVWYPPFRWEDFAKRAAPRPTEAPSATLGLPPQQVWFPPFRWDDFTRRAPRSPDFPAQTFGFPPAPPTQVWFPHDSWPDFVVKKQPALNLQPATFVPVVTVAVTWDQWSPWPDIVPSKPKPTIDFQSWTFTPVVPAPAQVWFPPGNWPDLTPPLPGQTMKAMRGRLAAGFSQVWFPPGNWPDSAPAPRRPVEFAQPAFVPPVVAPPPFVMVWTNWPDFAPSAKRPVDPQSFAFMALTPSATVVQDWPDYLAWKKPPLNYNPLALAPNAPAAATVQWNAWTNWPDLVPTRPRRTVDFQPWTFIPSPRQVFFPYAPWDDFTRRKRPPLDTQPLAWSSTQFATVAPTMAWTNWPDFVYKRATPLDTQLIGWSSFTPAPPAAFFLLPDRWPDFVYKKVASLSYPWTFVPTPAQVFFPSAPWGDFVRRKQPPLDTQPSAWSTFTPLQVVTYFTSQWPDFAPHPKPLVDIRPWTFIPTPGQVFFPYGPWDDFTRRKRPLNYDPLTFVQTVRTPWDTMTTWPDFAPIRGKLGLSAVQQQFTARFPGIITATTVTITMSAFEINADGALMAISVIQSQPATNAAVSIHEIGILGGSVTP